jgi:hypothetical protein
MKANENWLVGYLQNRIELPDSNSYDHQLINTHNMLFWRTN